MGLLPAAATPFMVAAVRAFGPDTWRGVLMRRDDPESAAALHRDAAGAGDAYAAYLLGERLAASGHVAGATAAWQPLIDSRSPEWAGPRSSAR